MALDLEAQIRALEVLVTQSNLSHEATLNARLGRVEDKFHAAEKAVDVALHANNKRLDAMNEFRDALNDTNLRMFTRVEGLATIQAAADQTLAQLQPLRDRVDLIGRPNYAMFVGYASLAVTLVAGIWLVIGLEINVSTAPMAVVLEQIKTSNLSRDSQALDQGIRIRNVESSMPETSQFEMQSKSDRTQLNERVRGIETQIGTFVAERRGQAAEINQRVSVIATQIEAADLRQEQWNVMMYEKLFPGMRFPGRR